MGACTGAAICTLAVVAPGPLEAVTVYAAWAVTAVGVPGIVPVLPLSVKPAGRTGLTVYEVTVPVTVGVSEAIAWPT